MAVRGPFFNCFIPTPDLRLSAKIAIFHTVTIHVTACKYCLIRVVPASVLRNANFGLHGSKSIAVPVWFEEGDREVRSPSVLQPDILNEGVQCDNRGKLESIDCICICSPGSGITKSSFIMSSH